MISSSSGVAVAWIALVSSGGFDSSGIETPLGQLLPRRGVHEAAFAVRGCCPEEGDECLP